MKVPLPNYRSPLGRFQPDVTDLEAMKRHGWRDITIRFACDRSTAWRRWQAALGVVVARLNGTAI